jgi:hypothetical protein
VLDSPFYNVIGLLRVSDTVKRVCFNVARNPLTRNAIPRYTIPNPSFPRWKRIDMELSRSLFPDGRRQAPLVTAVERTWEPPAGTSTPPPLLGTIASPRFGAPPTRPADPLLWRRAHRSSPPATSFPIYSSSPVFFLFSSPM